MGEGFSSLSCHLGEPKRSMARGEYFVQVP
jgi:hypothetical protein